MAPEKTVIYKKYN